MKTARFATIVEKSGRPEIHLLLTDPKKDTSFQRALKENRVMTVHHANVGNVADYGSVGFEKGPGQILIFPKSLRRFTDRRIVGINYELTSEPALQEGAIHLASAEAHSSSGKSAKDRGRNTKPLRSKSTRRKAEEASEESDLEKAERATKSRPQRERPPEARHLVAAIRRALKLLEADKPVAACKTLKNAVAE